MRELSNVDEVARSEISRPPARSEVDFAPTIRARYARRKACAGRQTRDHLGITARGTSNVSEEHCYDVCLHVPREHGKLVETQPAEVLIRPLDISPRVTLAEQHDVFAVMRLVEAPGIRGRQRPQVRNVAPQDRRPGPHHGDAGGVAD